MIEQAVSRMAAWFLRTLFPQVRCLACGEPRAIDQGHALCDRCTAALAEHAIPEYACPHCLSPVRSGKACAYCADGLMNGIAKAYAPFYYHGIVQRLVVQCKFGYADIAAQPLAAAMKQEIAGLSYDALVPVPLHRSNLRERGVNQAELLCRLIAADTDIRVLHALVKTRKTRRQSSLAPHARSANVKGAYQVVCDVRGLRLMLVDDVRTSGSTARECAAMLIQAGAAEVRLLTAAVAPQRRTGGHES